MKKPDEENYRRIPVKLGPAADALDLREPYSSRFYRSIEEMERIVKKEFYENVNTSSPVVSAIGHTHIDIAWLWTVDQTREKAVQSFSTVLELMDRYLDYKFMSSQPILYQFVKEQEPELYERIRDRVREGRWETDGAMWLESDCNLPAGESLVRQIIKGEQFFREEFGISNRCLWLPDVFGYSAAIPQILKKCGIPYFLTTKIAWNQFNQLPNDTFMWKGIDGSRVFVFMPTACDFDKTLGLNVSFTDTRNTTTYTGIVNPNMTLGTFKRFQNRDLTEDTLMLFGYGDGGGGPTKEMLEEAKRLRYGLPGIPRLVQENERNFFDRIYHDIASKPGMPVWDGKLYFEYHRGTLTSMGKNKRYNRKSQQMYEQLETLGVMAEFKGLAYPAGVIKKGWDIILLNQFHDIIPGSAIGPVYDQTDREYEDILKSGAETALHLAEDLGDRICGQGKDTGREKPGDRKVIVINTQGYEREDTVTVSGVARGEAAFACDCLGHWFPVQYTGEDTLIFHAKGIPSCGCAVYSLMGAEDSGTSGPAAEHSGFAAEHSGFAAECPGPWSGFFENDWYRAEFNDKMEIVSLVEKGTGGQLLKEGRVGNQLLTFEDRPMNWDNWDVDKTMEAIKAAGEAAYVVGAVESGEKGVDLC
uniref:alpha-mannosidase n=1 Tax=Enterocloster clostridioformis TaxID=1531 RepID=UPI0025A5EC69|nr:alpha-mannosidase [Enterocloster clostridioformis]